MLDVQVFLPNLTGFLQEKRRFGSARSRVMAETEASNISLSKIRTRKISKEGLRINKPERWKLTFFRPKPRGRT